MLVWLKYQYVKGKVQKIITDSIFKEEIFRIGRSGHIGLYWSLFFIQLQRIESKEFKLQKGCKGTIDNKIIFLVI